MPAQQPLLGQRRLEALGRVQQHLHHPLHGPVRRRQRPDVHAQAPGQGGTHLLPVERLAFDQARLQDVLGERLEDGLVLQGEAEAFHTPDEPALAVAEGGQRIGKGFRVPAHPGPSLALVDIGLLIVGLREVGPHGRSPAGVQAGLVCVSRIGHGTPSIASLPPQIKLITASCASIKGVIHRIQAEVTRQVEVRS